MRSPYKLIFSLFALFFTVTLHGQRERIDSLLIVLEKCATDSACAETMNWIGEQHQYIVGDFDSAMYYFKEAEEQANDATYTKGRALYLQGRLHLSNENHSELLRTAREAVSYFRETGTKRLVDALWLEAMYYGYMGPLDKGIELMKQAALIADSTEQYELAAILYSNMGTLSLQQGKRQEAIEYMLQSVEFRSKQGVEPTAELLTYIGSTYMEMEEYDQALPYFRQAAVELPGSAIRGEREEKMIVASAYLAMSRAFIQLNQYDSATVNLEKAQSLSLEINDSTGMANYHESLGDISLRQRDLNQAISHYQQVKRIMPVKALVSERSEVYLNLAESYLQRAAGKTGVDLDAARMNAKAAHDVAIEADLLEDKGQAAFILYQVFETLNQHKTSLRYASEYIAINDSLLTTKRLQAVSDMQTKYDTEKKQLEIDFLNQQNKQAEALQSNQRLIIIIMTLGIVATGLLLAWIYRIYLQKKRANNELSAKNDLIGKQNEEREILLKEIHHRVKNNLQVISSLLDIQGSQVEDESLQLAFEDGQSRVQAMALIHQKLSQNDNIGHISFKEYAEQLCNNLASIYGDKKVYVKIEGADAALDIDTAIPVGLILNELISNAFKYAFGDGQEGELNLKLEEQDTGNFQLTVADTGPGLPSAFKFDKARSLGLRLVRRLSQQLYGSSNYRYDKGSFFTINFKDTQLRKSMG